MDYNDQGGRSRGQVLEGRGAPWRRQNATPVGPVNPSIERLQTFAKEHPVAGSILQGFVWGLLMFIVFSVLTVFQIEELNLIVWSIGGALFGTAMYAYNRWNRKQGQPE